MSTARNHIHFLLNDELVEIDQIDASDTLLDFLRLRKRLRGTKEGCAEGDCGACTVLVGRLLDGHLVYETVNACIRFMASLDACHVVTIEHLRKSDGTLHPVQQAMVDKHGSQCGFCTPGFVMSLYALWMQNPEPSSTQVETALQGNLCRCTGYEAIVRAAMTAATHGKPEDDLLVVERQDVIEKLTKLNDGNRVEVGGAESKAFIPASVQDLADLRKDHPESTIIAGSTDVGLWVTKHMKSISPAIFIGNLGDLQKIEASECFLKFGAGVTYTQAYPEICKYVPQLRELWMRIGGQQVRNMGTIGGNIANGSPIGDSPPALIALGAKVILRCGHETRAVPLEKFFIEYGNQNRETGDFLESIEVPVPQENELYAVYKVSKRLDEDISSVLGAFKVTLEGGQISDCIIAFGGMAGIPKRASAVEAALIGKPWTNDTIEAAIGKFETDYQPLSDWRASAQYRMLVAKNLLRRFYMEMSESQSEPIRLERAAMGAAG